MPRRKSALVLQCAGEHTVGAFICYCILQMGHDGPHVDYMGKKWKLLFATWATRKANAKKGKR